MMSCPMLQLSLLVHVKFAQFNIASTAESQLRSVVRHSQELLEQGKADAKGSSTPKMCEAPYTVGIYRYR